MLNIGIIGTGCAGNKVAYMASKENFNVLLVNSTPVDLAGVEESDNCKMVLIGKNGCGKSRTTSQKMYAKVEEKFSENLSLIFKDESVVVVIGSTNNGTGSGSMPMICKTLLNKKKKVIAVPILPNDRTLRSMSNSLSCMKELNELNIPILPIDNNNAVSKNINAQYNDINEDIINDLKIMRGDYVEQSSPKYDNIDNRDLSKIILTPSILRMAKVTKIKQNMSKEELDNAIVDSIYKNYGPAIESDKVVSKLGIIYKLNSQLISYIDKEHKSLIESFGTPVEVYEHIEETNDESYVITIMSGLSMPVSLLSEYNEVLLNNSKNKPQDIKEQEFNLLDEDEDDIDDDIL